MSLAIIEFPNGDHIELGDNRAWSGKDLTLVAKANACIPSQANQPNAAANLAVVVAGYATQVAIELGGKVVYIFSRPAPASPPHAARDSSSLTQSSTFATVQFLNGAQLHIDANNIWTGDDAVLVAMANAYEPPGDIYRPYWAADVANEVAELLGGKVIFVKKLQDKMPPGTIY